MINSLKLSKLKSLAVSGGLIGAICVYSAPAYAQIDEVIVTARKVEENLQDVPVSVTAFTGELFEDAGLVEFADIAQLTPNFDVRASSTRGSLFADLTIRGQTTNVPEINSDQAVGIIINGAPVTRGTNLFSNLFDVEQIEVLKGPQGTLFGKNTTGGTVIVTTTAPKLNESSGYAEVDFGNFGRNDYEGVFNVGDETWALRVGASSVNRNGFGDGVTGDGTLTGREFADDNEEFYKASLLHVPNDQLSVRLNVDYHEVDEAGSIQRVLRDGFLGTFQIADITPGDDIFLAADNRLADTPEVSAEELNINGTIEYDLGWAELSSVTSYREQDSFTRATYANPIIAVNIGQDSDIFAQELRLSGQALDDRLTWQTGAFYSEEEGEDFNLVGFTLDLTEVQNESFALFAQGSYGLTDRLNFTGGVRWTDEERAVQDVSPDGRQAAEGFVAEQEVSFDDITWLASLDYKITDDILGYASVSTGFRSGFIDQNDLTNILEPETVTNYEAGFKSDLWDNRVRFNASAYYSDYSNIQIDQFAIDDFEPGETPGSPELIISNAAEATIWGFEAELQVQPTEQLFFSAGAGYTNGSFDEFIGEGTNIVVPDNPDTPDVNEQVVEVIDVDQSDEPIGGPEWQFNILGRYEFDLAPSIKAGAQLNYSWIDQRVLATDALAATLEPGQATVPSIGLFNGQIDFDVNESWNVAFYGKNIFDNEYFSTGFAIETAGGLAQRIVGDPRTYGVRVRKSF